MEFVMEHIFVSIIAFCGFFFLIPWMFDRSTQPKWLQKLIDKLL